MKNVIFATASALVDISKNGVAKSERPLVIGLCLFGLQFRKAAMTNEVLGRWARDIPLARRPSHSRGSTRGRTA